jgi:HPt (histidine-containing phosphotransfer) domain-containing protein
VSAEPEHVLDAAALERLRDSVGDEFVGELVGTFLDDAPVQLTALRNALEAGDAEAARRAAHTLKSNGATFGASRFSETCRTLEEMAKARALADAEPVLRRAEQEYAGVGQALAPMRAPVDGP